MEQLVKETAKGLTVVLNTQMIGTRAEFINLHSRLVALASEITLPKPLSLGVVVKYHDEFSQQGCTFIRVGDREGKCNVTGEPLAWWGRKWYISPHMTDAEIVTTIFLACKVAMEHELREGFTFSDQMIFDPHKSLDTLVYAASSCNREERGKP
jgi:hypothetical protein